MATPGNVVELLQALIRIPSINPHGGLDAGGTGEGRCAEFVGQFLAERRVFCLEKARRARCPPLAGN